MRREISGRGKLISLSQQDSSWTVTFEFIVEQTIVRGSMGVPAMAQVLLRAEWFRTMAQPCLMISTS